MTDCPAEQGNVAKGEAERPSCPRRCVNRAGEGAFPPERARFRGRGCACPAKLGATGRRRVKATRGLCALGSATDGPSVVIRTRRRANTDLLRALLLGHLRSACPEPIPPAAVIIPASRRNLLPPWWLDRSGAARENSFGKGATFSPEPVIAELGIVTSPDKLNPRP